MFQCFLRKNQLQQHLQHCRDTRYSIKYSILALIAANPSVKLLITVLTRARANTNKRHAKRAREDPSLVISHFVPKAPVHPIIDKVYHNIHTVYIHNLSESASYRAAVVMSRTLRSLMGWRSGAFGVCVFVDVAWHIEARLREPCG